PAYANYSQRTDDLTLSLDEVANDGDQATGEADFLHADIEIVAGGQGNDHIIGNEFDNTLIGDVGNDTLEGLGGSDTLFGDAGDDSLDGGDGDDTLQGAAGD